MRRLADLVFVVLSLLFSAKVNAGSLIAARGHQPLALLSSQRRPAANSISTSRRRSLTLKFAAVVVARVLALARSPPIATVVFIHGGAWQAGDKSDARSFAPTFTSNGYRLISVNYPMSSVAKHPAPVETLERLLSQIPSDKLFLMGHSAGAHMIGFWNSEHTSPRVYGFIGIEGIYDIPNLVQHWPTYGNWFIAAEFGTDKSRWPGASPTRLKMKSARPWLIVHSEKDELVDLAQSSDFVAHLTAAKIPVDFVRLHSDSHFGAVNNLGDPASEVSRAVVKFVRATMK